MLMHAKYLSQYNKETNSRSHFSSMIPLKKQLIEDMTINLISDSNQPSENELDISKFFRNPHF